jgi:lipopolysaccharide/colanic/teichoic acid biosynthesis glycosyltransferase
MLFRIHKFRTMQVNTEVQGQLTVGADSRVTGAGRFLRKSKLDELPQLLDVLFGDMSLVGPRPEVPKYVAHYPDEVKDIVLSVRPGITDWASIRMIDENEILGRAADPDALISNRSCRKNWLLRALCANPQPAGRYPHHLRHLAENRAALMAVKVDSTC